MNAKVKFGITVLAAALLLVSPFNACTSMAATSQPAHPCCPKAPAPPADCHMVGCVCANASPSQASQAVVPPNNDPAPMLAALASGDVNLEPVVASEEPALVPFLPASHDRYLSIHQLLL